MRKRNGAFYEVLSLKNRVERRGGGNASAASVFQIVEIESERDGIVFISQHLDGIEMFEAVRYPLVKGRNVLELKPMRIVNPRLAGPGCGSVSYLGGIAVFASGAEREEIAEEFFPGAEMEF